MRRFHVSQHWLAGLVLATLPSLALADWDQIVGLTVSSGGDTLAKLTFSDKSSQHIRAGQRIEMYYGLVYKPEASPYSARLTLGYQSAGTSPDHGSVKQVEYPFAGTKLTGYHSVNFSRMPVELLGLFRLAPYWLVGAGLRKSINPKLNTNNSANGDYELNSRLGQLVQAEWLITPNASVVFKHVRENYVYQGASGDTVISGNQIGIGMNVRF